MNKNNNSDGFGADDLNTNDEILLKIVASEIHSEEEENLEEYEKYYDEFAEDENDKKPLKSRTKKSEILVPLLLTAICVVFTGAVMIKHFTATITDNVTYSSIEKTPDYKDIKKHGFQRVPSALIDNYKLVDFIVTDDELKIVFNDNNDNIIVFTESTTALAYNVDTEDIEITTIILSNGVEAVVLYKNGVTLLWEIDGYFYMIYTDNPSIDILQIAPTLEKI